MREVFASVLGAVCSVMTGLSEYFIDGSYADSDMTDELFVQRLSAA